MLSWSLSPLLTVLSVSQGLYWTGRGGIQEFTAALLMLWSRAAHLPARIAETSLTFTQLHSKRLQGGEGKTGSPPSTAFAIPVFPFTFSLLCPTEEAHCLHLKREDTSILMGPFQLEKLYDYTTLVPHAVPFPVVLSLFSPC